MSEYIEPADNIPLLGNALKRIDMNGNRSVETGEPSQWALAYAKSKFKKGQKITLFQWMKAIEEGTK